MVAVSAPDPRRHEPPERRRHAPRPWLALAAQGTATDLAPYVPGGTILVVTDARRFRDTLLAERPRVVVCMEPPASGAVVELVADVRRRRPAMRAVHLAPPEAVAQRLAALRLGFDDAYATSMPADELAGRLSLLDTPTRSRAAIGAVLPVGEDAELDLVAHELRRAGLAVHLRPKEFGLLALLAAHPGRAYTRQQLLDRVWGPDHAGGARTVDVHVRWLRSKIEPDPDQPIRLVTVRGVGYRLDEPHR